MVKKCLLLIGIFILVGSFQVFAGGSAEEEGTGAKPTEIKVGLWDWEIGTIGQDDIAKLLNEKFDIKIVPYNLSWGDYIQKLNVAAASGDLPDMFAHPAQSDLQGRPIFHKWVREGIIQPLPDDYAAKYPNIGKLLEDYDFFKVKGKHYMIPRIAWQPENGHMSGTFIVREDWMENLGIPEPDPDNWTLEDFTDLLYKFTYEDPDGNGENDTFGKTPGWSQARVWIFNVFQRPTGNWVKEDGQWIPTELSNRIPEALKVMRKLYVDKVLDQDFATIKFEDAMDKFISSKAGVISWQGEAYHVKNELVDKFQKVHPDLGIKVCDVLPWPTTKYGEAVVNNQYNHWSGTLFNAQASPEKMDKMLQLYDFLLSDEGFQLGRFGIEGKHFTKENGKIVSLLPIDETTGLPKQIYKVVPTSGIIRLVSWDVDGRWLEPGMPKSCVDLEKKVIRFGQHLQNDVDPRITYMSSPARDTFQIYNEFEELYIKCIVSNVDIDEEFQKFKTRILEQGGGSEAIKETNEYAQELGL